MDHQSSNSFQSINLIPGARQDAKLRRIRTRRWFTTAVTYGVVVMFVAVLTRLVWVIDSRSVSGQLAGLLAEIEHSDSAAKSLRTDLKLARDLSETRNVIADQPDWSLLLALLAANTHEDVVLRSVQLTQDEKDEATPAPVAPADSAATATGTPNIAAANVGSGKERQPFTLTLAGLGKSQFSVSQFLLRLEQMKFFEHVRLLETKREPFLAEDAIAFQIVCTMR